jgi:hypothetical protein
MRWCGVQSIIESSSSSRQQHAYAAACSVPVFLMCSCVPVFLCSSSQQGVASPLQLPCCQGGCLAARAVTLLLASEL